MLEVYNIFLKELYRAFDFLNQTFFGEQIKGVPIITLQRDDKAKFLGWCSREKVWHEKSNGSSYYEINLTSQFLSRDIMEVLATLLHEMIHLYCNEQGIKDCTKAGIHNRKFKESSEAHGLVVGEKTKKGWNHTMLSERSKVIIGQYLEEHPIYVIYRDGKKEPSEKKKGDRIKATKWICPTCGMVLRSKNSKIIYYCKECNAKMTEEKTD